MLLTDLQFYIALLILALLYIAFIYTAHRLADKFSDCNSSDYVQNTDHLFTDFGTKSKQ